MKKLFVELLVKFLDVFMFNLSFKNYFRKRFDALIINNLSHGTINIVQFTKKNHELYGFVFKYPFIKKVIVNKIKFDLMYPGLINNMKRLESSRKEFEQNSEGFK